MEAWGKGWGGEETGKRQGRRKMELMRCGGKGDRALVRQRIQQQLHFPDCSGAKKQ